MRKLGVALTMLCALATTPTWAAEKAEFQISPRAGRGELKLDQFKNVDADLAEVDTAGLGVSFGVLTPIGVVLEIGTETYGNFNFFNADDEFTLRQHYLGVGYQFELGDGWRIVPKVGRSKWELTSDKGWLFHDDDVVSKESRGYENFWELGFGKRVNDVMTLGASVRSGDFDFGSAGSVSFVMTFGF
ncbi:MAG: hypothetical protein ACJ8OJ_23425 [Povalibacter sp.]|jgi:hypothetical protein